LYPVILLALITLFTREVIAPASGNACDKRWQILSFSLATVSAIASLVVGWLLSGWQSFALMPLGGKMPDVLLGFLCFLSTSFILLVASRHPRFRLLWRHVHQLHHSALRIESLTAFFAHPLETAAATMMSSFSSYLLFGATPVAAMWGLIFTGLFDLYLHSDTRSPRWLGYFIQRPEMHRVHHAWEHHAQNYGLPLWDMLFGTWNNTEQWIEKVGFDPEKSGRINDMLCGRDVHKTL
jgi:sterol desaturase/sphingolipid hydroxylase (fatty acid hydroxylase superfamily)